MRRFERNLVAALGLVLVAGLVSSAVPIDPTSLASTNSSVALPTPAPPSLTPSLSAEPEAGGTPQVQIAPAFSGVAGDTPIGPLPAAQTVTVAVGLSGTNGSSLAALIAAIYAPGSPEYRSFRSASSLASSFGATASAVSAAESYFEERGVSATLSPDRLLLFVQGPSDRVAAAFGTTFEQFRAPDGRLFYSHTTPATLPGIAPWSGAVGLGNATEIVPATVGSPESETPVTPAAGCAADSFGLTPCEIWEAYNMTSLISGGTNGSGIRLAVVDAYSSDENQEQLTSDLATFDADNGLSAGNVNFLYPVPGPGNLNQSSNPAWSLEDALDLEWARASAPGATIDMTFSPNAGVGLYQAVDWLVAHQSSNVISLSWGEPDVGVFNAYSGPCTSACNASSDGSYGILSPVLAFAAAEGISVFAATGDCGAADGTSGVATNFPASDPDVTGVGGTVLDVDPNGTYVAETAWSGNATGAVSPGCENQGGSGGGFSPFPRPLWQTGLPTGETQRGIPDVALDAGTAVMIIRAGASEGVGGTSVATPIWAGIAALADQDVGRPLGLVNPTLYAIASGADYSRDFHDILSGSNGYSAGPGWDPVTGWGSPRVASLVVDLAHPPSVSEGHPTSFVYASPRLGAAPLSVTFRVNVTGGTGIYPLEGVDFGDGTASFAPNGSTTHTFTRPGVYSVQAYAADSAANYSVSPPVVIVVGGGHALSVNLTASTETPASGAPVEFSVLVSGGVGPYQYNFSFGDGTFFGEAGSASTNHTYGAAGSFCAAVVVSDSASPMDGGASERVAVGVGGAALPDCENDTIPLTITPKPNPGVMDAPADYSSLFSTQGGSTGVSSLGPSLQYSSTDPYLAACECTIFRSPGTYDVTAYANDSVNQQVNASVVVTVAPPLVAQFTSSLTFGVAPLTVNFSSTASGGDGANPATTNWTFGDGTSAVGASVTDTYTVPGSYVAVGHLADRGGGNASEAFLVDVATPGTSAGPATPYLVGTITPAVDVPTGAPVNFTAQLFGPGGAEMPAVFSWHLGSSPPTTGFGAHRPSFNWTSNWLELPANGTLVATLGATAVANGLKGETQFSLPSFAAVDRLPSGEEFHPEVDALELVPGLSDTTASPATPWNGTVSVSGPGVLSTDWVFGDGSQATTPAVRHFFSEGFYTTVATASDSWGDSATVDYPVESASPFELSADVTPTSGTPPLEVVFHANASGGVGPPYQFFWSFGNGTGSTATNGTAVFDVVGTHQVSVTVSDLGGFGGSMSWTVTVRTVAGGLPVLILLGAGAAIGVGMAVYIAVVVRRDRPTPFTP